ncbi:MAG: 4-hydroxybenzoate octaprenyltransferase [Thermoleophilia bacterium]|nr:4-hydroxybenzoate octaprenyltransferase [Thermoleophilia bacterium]MCZ4497143.1 4-hydroxybenzoate octaprenyltransferase [Thermoleophilia bacterium]
MGTAAKLASLVKLEHTIFALPFAYAGMVLGARAADVDITVAMVLWITAAMVGARTLAMGLNRVIDASIDARNPRTAGRELPTGLVSRSQVWLLCAASLVLLIVATFQLDEITRLLWPIPVALFVLYPYTKRFTWLCHLVLGLSIGLAPLGAWLAVGADGSDPVPYLLWLGIATWIGGFDVIYATEDVDFDRANGLNSLPARFGVGPALAMVRVAHAATIAAFGIAGSRSDLNPGFWVALVVAAGLLVWENSMVSADDLTRLDKAFFTINSYVGVVLGVGLMVGTI